MILILSARSDGHVSVVTDELGRRGVRFVVLDPAELPSAKVRFSCGSRRPRRQPGLAVETGGEIVDLSEVRSVWLRRPGRIEAPGNLREGPAREVVAEEWTTFLDGFWQSAPWLWLPAPPPWLAAAEHKPRQLALAAELGFEIPETRITNDPAELLAMFSEQEGRLVSKGVGRGFAAHVGNSYRRYTEPVRPRDLVHAEALRLCPVILQAEVPKKLELRVTVVGQQVFTAEIDSQATARTRYDWRRYDRHRTRHGVHQLPVQIEQRCLGLVEGLGLRYGAIDLILTPDDRYVFLEINPNGQWQWIEQATGLPIAAAVCDLLSAECSSGLRDRHQPSHRGLRHRLGSDQDRIEILTTCGLVQTELPA